MLQGKMPVYYEIMKPVPLGRAFIIFRLSYFVFLFVFLAFKSLFHFPIKMSKSLQYPVKLFRSLDVFLQPGTDSCFPHPPVLLARDVWTRSNQTRSRDLSNMLNDLALLAGLISIGTAWLLDQNGLTPGQDGRWTEQSISIWPKEQVKFPMFPPWSRHFLSQVLRNATFRAESKAS